MRTALKIVNLSMLLFLAGCAEKDGRRDDADRNQAARQTGPADEREGGGSNSDGGASPGTAEVTLRVATPQEYRDVIAGHAGKVVLVDFWATWCAPCRKQFPHTVEMSREYADRGLAVVSVSMDDLESRKDALEFLKEHEATVTNLIGTMGAEEQAMQAYGIEPAQLPHYKVFGRDGEPAATLHGEEATPEAIEMAVRSALGAEDMPE